MTPAQLDALAAIRDVRELRYSDLQALLDEAREAGRLREALERTARPAAGATEQGHWWCPCCQVPVDPTCVTFEEYHYGCGRMVRWIEPEPRADGVVLGL